MKRGKPLARGKPMARGPGPKRTKPVNPVNRKRRKKMHKRNYGAPHPERGDNRGDRVRAMPCEVARVMGLRQGWPVEDCARMRACVEKIDAAHTEPIKMGGVGGDCTKIVSLCRVHHGESGEFRTSQRAEFEECYGVDLVARAAEIDEQLTAEGYP